MSVKPKLVWDRWNTRHIRKHRVTKSEVEEAYTKSKFWLSVSKDRKLIYGKTQKGRYLTVVLSTKKQVLPYVVTARNMNNKERRKYYVTTQTN